MTLQEARASGKWYKRPHWEAFNCGGAHKNDGTIEEIRFFRLSASDLDANDYILEEPVKKKVRLYRPIFKIEHSGNYDLYNLGDQWSPYKGHWKAFKIVCWDEREIEVEE